MPAKKQQRGQKVDVTALFGGKNDENNLDWAAGHNYDEADAQEAQNAKNAKSPIKDDRHVAITKAASFGNFRDEGQKQCGVPDDMPPPYVCFVKTFGKTMTEEIMRSYFPDSDIQHVLLINNDRALYCLIEFGRREDLARSLMVTGAKMQYQHPCTVDIASPEQVEKMQNFAARKQQRSGGRSPTSPKPSLNFDRDAFQSQTAPEGDFGDDGDSNDGGQRKNNKFQNMDRNNFGAKQGMSRSVSNNLLDGGRDALFGSADPVPPPPEGFDNDNNNGGNNNNKNRGAGRFGGNRIAVSSASAEFSRDAVFGTAAPSSNSTNQSPNGSPNPTGRPQFGRNASSNSIGGGSEGEGSEQSLGNKNSSSQQQKPKEFSRDMFGGAEAPPPPPPAAEDNDNKNSSGKGRGNGGGNGGGDRFARRSPVTAKESTNNGGDAGDRFGNFRKQENTNGASKSSSAGSWRN